MGKGNIKDSKSSRVTYNVLEEVVWMKRLIFIFFMTLIFIPYVYAGEPSKDPILRIETGMHTGIINRIGIDAENRYLVTGSDDKTIRIWNIKTGRLLKTIRPPIGNGDEGKIYSVAISPDGRHIAAGGYTGYEWDNAFSIYIFERESGSLIKRITGLPEVINHLSYSKDGRYLVACLWKYGIKIYRTSNYSLVKEDKDYGDSSYGADFDPSGRLVTTSFDGYIRLYDSNFRLIQKKKAKGGNKPFGISFSPDGSKIAVGYLDSENVDVYSGKDLSYLYSPETEDVNGDLTSVSWSSDGRYLFAGGTAGKSVDDEWKDFIRIWKDEGKGEYTDLEGDMDTIMHILPLKNGGFIFGSGEPSFGVVDGSWRLSLYKKPYIADLRGNLEEFLVSYDGFTVRFGYESFGGSPAVFSVSDESLILNPEPKGVILNPPITEAEGLNITDWEDSYEPKLNGKPLELMPYERSRSLAILPDRSGFILGTDWGIYHFDRDGNIKWRIPVPEVTWGVNVSGDGRVVVAAFGDGTIRWYRVEDGEELLALFPHNDRKTWVLWTPSGYYTSSAGGEDLIGWHINNGKDKEADFFPAGRFRSVYYRPDVIAKVTETLNEKEAIKLANKESGRKEAVAIKDILPPVIRILSPSDGEEVSKEKVLVRFAIKNPSGEPLTGIRVLVDGRPIEKIQRFEGLRFKERGIVVKGKDEKVAEITVTIPQKDCEISLIAENRYSASEPSSIKVRWRGEKKDEFIIKPKLYVLAIGISNYQNKDLTLQFASKDAQDFVKVIESQKGKLYRDLVVKLIVDEKATRDEILDGLDWLQRETTSKDVAMVFFAGHGVNDQAGVYYFLPANADTEKLKRTGVAFSDIKNTVASIAGKVVVFVDTCHSGNIMGARRGVADITAVVNELSSAESGAVVFASSTGRQYSLEDPAWKNGAFTKALVEGLRGKADFTGDGKITINELDLFLSEKVKELTKGKQTPTTTKPNTIQDFPIAVK